MSTAEPPPWGTAPPVAPSPAFPAIPSASADDPSAPAPAPAPRPGRISGCAWAGIGVGLAVFVALGGFVAAVLLGDDGTPAPDGRATVASLVVGACAALPADGAGADSVATQRCAGPHEAEVLAVGVLDAAAFPGDAVAQRTAALRCLAAFEPSVGAAYEDSSLEVTVLSPTAARWAAGDRSYACLVHDASGADLPGGSVRATRR